MIFNAEKRYTAGWLYTAFFILRLSKALHRMRIETHAITGFFGPQFRPMNRLYVMAQAPLHGEGHPSR